MCYIMNIRASQRLNSTIKSSFKNQNPHEWKKARETAQIGGDVHADQMSKLLGLPPRITQKKLVKTFAPAVFPQRYQSIQPSVYSPSSIFELKTRNIDPSKTYDNELSHSVAILGLPNCGKSTLFNRLVGPKLSATSILKYTTKDVMTAYRDRHTVQRGDVDLQHTSSGRELINQLIVKDLPPITDQNRKDQQHRPSHILENGLSKNTWDILQNDVDTILLMVDASQQIIDSSGAVVLSDDTVYLLKLIKKLRHELEHVDIQLVFNKCSSFAHKVEKSGQTADLVALQQACQKVGRLFESAHFIDANSQQDTAITELLNNLYERSKPRPNMYESRLDDGLAEKYTVNSLPAFMLTTTKANKLAADVIREKIFQQAYSGVPMYLPYTINVKVDYFTLLKRKSLADLVSVDNTTEQQSAPSFRDCDAIRIDATVITKSVSDYEKLCEQPSQPQQQKQGGSAPNGESQMKTPVMEIVRSRAQGVMTKIFDRPVYLFLSVQPKA
ncbi:hypothetical protein MP228_000203 [Amoeboaphelidium protococcarum]|nr:hypothetical protein MP228_000203 [Amoeboaphelidium protococcarum]